MAREGAKHKLGMLFVVIVAGITDITLAVACEHLPMGWDWPLPQVFAWYILENAVKMGAPIPEWLMDLLAVGLKAINARGEALPDTEENEVNIE